MTTETTTTATNQTPALPNLTIISHGDTQHDQANEILEAIELAIKGIELFAPLVVQIIQTSGNRVVAVPSTVQPTQT